MADAGRAKDWEFAALFDGTRGGVSNSLGLNPLDAVQEEVLLSVSTPSWFSVRDTLRRN